MKVLSKHVLASVALVATALSVAPQAPAQFDPPRPSPKATVSQTIGLTEVTVAYCRPGVKGRTIWGELVPYGQVWRTGANEATTITTSTDLTMNGAKLPAGTYSVHTIPQKGEWTVILNKDAKQWGSYSYDEKKDAARFTVKPEAGAHEESMSFRFDNVTASSADLVLSWEKVRLPLKLEVDTLAAALASAKDAVEKSDRESWRTPLRAANYLLDSKSNYDQALTWADRSIAAGESFSNQQTRARILAAQGKTADAVKAGERALAVAKTNKPAPDPETVKQFEKTVAEWKAKK